jgi:hypothetical protein
MTRPRALPDHVIAALVERVRRGEHIKVVAAEAGIQRETLSGYCREGGLPPQPKTPDPITIWQGKRVRDRALAVLEEKQRATRAELVAALSVPHQSLQFAVQQLIADGCVWIAGTIGRSAAHIYEPVP